MDLRDYFEFQKFGEIDSIRVKGTRIGIEHIIEPYLEGDSPERIFHGFRHALTLEQVCATITYYLQNKAELNVYLERGRTMEQKAYEEYLKQEPPEVVKRMRKLAAERQKSGIQSP